MNDLFDLHPEVEAALNENRPVVALESTVITHGLAYPVNLETARSMEYAVRQGDAVPATIAIIQGRITVGLTEEQLEYLAAREQKHVRKCSRRDLALAIGGKEDGATTVAGTMLVAHMVGIELFATGGIGGVHRGNDFDISADLLELGRTPVTVVCSGAKSILDLPKTREVLESHGVAIIGYGTDELPAFFSRSSGLEVDLRLDTAEQVAAVIDARRSLRLQSGILVAVPVPATDEFDSQEAEAAVAQATEEAHAAGVHGPATTPWLLQRVSELTNGSSVSANIALLRNNGFVAGQIAAALSAIPAPR